MNNNFGFEIINITRKECVVLSSDYISLTEKFSGIEKKLLKENFNGRVYFDYLLNNGSKHNRFFSIDFDGHLNKPNDLKKVKNVPLSIKTATMDFYNKNYFSIIENSILKQTYKFFIRKKILF